MNMVLSLMTTLMTKGKHDDMARTLDVGIEAIEAHWNTQCVQMTHSVVICSLMGYDGLHLILKA